MSISWQMGIQTTVFPEWKTVQQQKGTNYECKKSISESWKHCDKSENQVTEDYRLYCSIHMNSRQDKMILAKTRSEVAKGWGEGRWLQRGLKWKYHILCLDFGGGYTKSMYITYVCQNSSNCTLKIENFLNYTPDFLLIIKLLVPEKV